MDGNSGVGFTDTQYTRRPSLNGKNSSKGISTDDKGNGLRLSSRGFERYTTKPSAGYGKYSGSSSSTNIDYTNLSVSASSSSNLTLASKDAQASSHPALGSAHCLSGITDDSGSDLDVELSEQVGMNGFTAKVAVGWRSSATTSSASRFTPYVSGTSSSRMAHARQSRGHVLDWGESHRASASGSTRVHGDSSAAHYTHPCGISNYRQQTSKPLGSSSSSGACLDDYIMPLNLDRRGRFTLEGPDTPGDETGGTEGSGQSIQVDASRRLTQSNVNTIGESKRKNILQATSNRRGRHVDLQSPGLRESTLGVSMHGLGSSRRSLSNLGCSSSSDVLPSVSLSPVSGAPDGTRQKKPVGSYGTTGGGEPLKSIRLGKSRVGSGSSSGTGSSFDSLCGSPHNFSQHSSELEPSRPIRQLHTNLPTDMRSLKRPVQSKPDPNTHSSSFSLTDCQLYARRRGASPIVTRGRGGPGSLYRSREQMNDSSGALGEDSTTGSAGGNTGAVSRSGFATLYRSRSREHLNESIGTVGEDMATSSASNSDRILSRSAMYRNHLSGTSTFVGRNSSRNRSHSPPIISSSLGSEMPEYLQSSISGSPPTRLPPLPPPPASSQTRVSENALLLSSISSTTHTSDGSSNISPPRLEDGFERSNLPPAYGSHSLQLQSIEENRHHLTVEGLSEILSTLERIERDEDLTYEQILMLEATILLGGIGLHDRHRDMRLDVDNMSYEELLALEERIGSVSTGLSGETISNCVKKVLYASPKKDADYIPQDIEIKCSICQEEFEEAVELGVLECGHSHHVACIKQWLIQKNQCPICKASAFT